MSCIRISPTPVTHIGWGATEQWINEVKTFNATKILVIANPVLKQIGLVDQLHDHLQ